MSWARFQIVLACLASLAPHPALAGDLYQLVPLPIEQCVAEERGALQVDFGNNPFYLRGDFDGDGKVDHAVMVYKGSPRRSGFQAGLLICHGSGKRRLTGDGLGPELEGGESDYLGAANWEVVPSGDPAAKRFDAEGELILMQWEDGAAAILLSNDEYRWRWLDSH